MVNLMKPIASNKKYIILVHLLCGANFCGTFFLCIYIGMFAKTSGKKQLTRKKMLYDFVANARMSRVSAIKCNDGYH